MVSKLLQPAQIQKVPRLALSRQETADALGVSINTVDAWIRDRNFPHVKVGRCLLVPIHETRKWLSTHLNSVDS